MRYLLVFLMVVSSYGAATLSTNVTGVKATAWTITTNPATAIAALTVNGIPATAMGSTNGNITATYTTQLYCCNGTNQLVTLPDAATYPWTILRFSSTNGWGSFVLTNATGSQTIRDGASLSFKHVGIGEIGVYSDGVAWWLASKAKVIMPNAQFSCSTNIPLTLANTAYPVTFDSTDFNNSQGIALVSGQQMWITNAGQYEFDPSIVQLFNGNDTIRFWFKREGTNIANSSTPSKGQNGSVRVITVPFIVSVTNATYFEIWAQSDTTGESLMAETASGNYPAAPSVICPVKRISDPWP